MSASDLWWDKSWNPITGCSPVSEGCANCYARRFANRFRGRFGYPEDEPFRVTVHWDKINDPPKSVTSVTQKQRLIFVCSMGDLFHDKVRYHVQSKILDVCQWFDVHNFLFLTKRPNNMKMVFERWYNDNSWIKRDGRYPLEYWWLGITAENQRRADERIPVLLQIPAAVRWVSLEPLLGPVTTLFRYFEKHICADCGWELPHHAARPRDYKHNWICPECGSPYCEENEPKVLHWVVIGCETGPRRRPCKLEWVRDIIEQCDAAGVPVFVKQLEINGKVSHDLADWPEWARRREFPHETNLQ